MTLILRATGPDYYAVSVSSPIEMFPVNNFLCFLFVSVAHMRFELHIVCKASTPSVRHRCVRVEGDGIDNTCEQNTEIAKKVCR